MRIPLWAYIAAGILLWIFAYGYFNYPITNQADRYYSSSQKKDTYCNTGSLLDKVKCRQQRAAKAKKADLKNINTVSNFKDYLKNPNSELVRYSKFDCASIKNEFIDVNNSNSIDGDVFELLPDNGLLQTISPPEYLATQEDIEIHFGLLSSISSKVWDAALMDKSLSDEIDPTNAIMKVNLFEFVRIEFDDMFYQHSFGNVGPCKAN